MAPRRLVRPASPPATETREHVTQAQYKLATPQQLKGGQRKALQTCRCCGATAKDRGRNSVSVRVRVRVRVVLCGVVLCVVCCVLCVVCCVLCVVVLCCAVLCCVVLCCAVLCVLCVV